MTQLTSRRWFRKKWQVIRSSLRLGQRFSRGQYRDVWNAVSITEADALLSVQGANDEEGLRIAAGVTLERFRRCIEINSDDTVLDIGCGVGRMGAILAPICKHWIGVDVSENMVAHTTRRLAGYDNVTVLLSRGNDLGLVDSNSVDLVYSTVVFMHLDEWDRFSYVREGFRVLRPGGRMLVDNINLLSDEGWDFFLGHLEQYTPESRPPNISKTSTPDELRAYFERAGFADIRQAEDGLWISVFGKKPRP